MKNKPYLLIILSGVFLFLDQFLKWQSLHAWNVPKLFWKYFGWYPFLNSGVAFSIPLPNWLTLVVTWPVILGIGLWLGYNVMRKKEIVTMEFFGVVLVLFGAVSNLTDRIIYGSTLDYLRFFTGVINLADVMIVVGMLLNIKYKKLK